jgi:hypothetical protein
MESTRPPCFWRKAGVQGSSKAWSRAPNPVGGAEGEGTAAGADGVEEIEHALVGDLDGHGDFGGVEAGETGANALSARDYAADTGGDVVGAFVAEDLEGHPGSCLAFEGGIGRILGPGTGEGGEKAAHGGAETGAGDIDFHGLAVVIWRGGGGGSGFHAHSGFLIDVAGRVQWFPTLAAKIRRGGRRGWGTQLLWLVLMRDNPALRGS